jgi:DNA-binding transcriptional regulator YhcF (GntR family)
MAQITVRTDEENGEPVYRQVARQLRDMIVSSQLLPGFRLPAVRTLASDLGVNLNTIARAYWVLEEEGFVRIRGRSGAEVLAPAPAPTNGVPRELRQTLREVLARLRQAGLGFEELRQMVMREIDTMSPTEGGGRS